MTKILSESRLSTSTATASTLDTTAGFIVGLLVLQHPADGADHAAGDRRAEGRRGAKRAPTSAARRSPTGGGSASRCSCRHCSAGSCCCSPTRSAPTRRRAAMTDNSLIVPLRIQLLPRRRHRTVRTQLGLLARGLDDHHHDRLAWACTGCCARGRSDGRRRSNVVRPRRRRARWARGAVGGVRPPAAGRFVPMRHRVVCAVLRRSRCWRWPGSRCRTCRWCVSAGRRCSTSGRSAASRRSFHDPEFRSTLTLSLKLARRHRGADAGAAAADDALGAPAHAPRRARSSSSSPCCRT